MGYDAAAPGYAGGPNGSAPGTHEQVGRGFRSRHVAGTATRLALTGGVLAGGGALAARVLLLGRNVPPWVEVAMFAAVATFALVGMGLGSRAAARYGSPAGAPAPEPEPMPVDASGQDAVHVAPDAVHVAPDAVAVAPGAVAVTPVGTPGGTLEHFQVVSRGSRQVIPAAELEWIEASGNYARLHLPGKSFLYRMPLGRMELELDARDFLRVHRSAIVNLRAVTRVAPLPSGDADLWLASGAQVRLSRRYARAFHDRTGRPR